MSVIFISETYVKENTPLNDNVDFNQLIPDIEAVQDMYIEPLIGSGIYNQLKTQITGNTLTVLNQTLLDNYILPCLKWHIMAYSPVAIHFKFTNKGVVVKQGGDSSTPANLEELNKVASEYEKRAEFYAERLIKYLAENHTLYPLYNDPGNGIDTVYPKRNGYTTPLVLGGGRKCRIADLPPDER